MLLTAAAEAAASSLKISLGRRFVTPFGRGGRFGYSAMAYRGSRLANVRATEYRYGGTAVCGLRPIEVPSSTAATRLRCCGALPLENPDPRAQAKAVLQREGFLESSTHPLGAAAIPFLIGSLASSGKRDDVPSEAKRQDVQPSTVPATESKSRGCVIGIPGKSDDVPGYRTRKKYDEPYELARAGATDREMLLHLVGDGGKMIPSGTACEYADVGIMSSQVIVKEGSFRMQKFFLPTEWTRYDAED